MIEAICAGIVIGLGSVANLYVGGPMGSVLYAIVIMSVIYYDLDLFVGHTGILNSVNTDIIGLFLILLWNLVGVSIIAVLTLLTPVYRTEIMAASQAMWEYYGNIGMWGMIPLGIFCGLTMYGGLVVYKKTENYMMTMIPIMMCVLSRWPFVPNMVFHLWFNGGRGWELVICTLIGNLIGCNAWLLIRRPSDRFKNELKPQRKSLWDYFRDTK